MSVIIGTTDNFEEEVLNSKIRTLVDFNATWCGPCRMLAPILEDFAKDNSDIKVISINVDEAEDLAGRYHVFSIPCLVVFEDGKEVKRNVGFMQKEELEKFIGE